MSNTQFISKIFKYPTFQSARAGFVCPNFTKCTAGSKVDILPARFYYVEIRLRSPKMFRGKSVSPGVQLL